MNIAEYKNLSKIIATYLKLDFQTEVLTQLSTNNCIRRSAFISDEFHEYVTTTDADFFAQNREAKCINILATQSYTSIKNAIKDDSATKVILQNLINKLWFRTDDIFTIEEAQKQIGKEEKEKISTTISENAKETKLNLITNNLISRDSNISESYNKYTQNDYIYDTNYFSQSLETFNCLAFISNGLKILKPTKLQMIPYYKNEINRKD
ncbi:MAG: TraM recognition domain-containing protein [Clostridia bacterium]|nr:TraM recognition domain-containing protein [Clostridia bacterium]